MGRFLTEYGLLVVQEDGMAILTNKGKVLRKQLHTVIANQQEAERLAKGMSEAKTDNVKLIERLAEEHSKLTSKQINESRKKCMKCKYRQNLGGAGANQNNIFCNWAEITGHRFRDCLPSECKYFEKGRPIRKPVVHLCL